jgi:hypothetical protein
MVEGKGVYKLIQSGIRQYRLQGLSGPVQSISSTGNNSICLRNNNLLFLLNGPQVIQKKFIPKPGLVQTVWLHNKWYAFYSNGLLETEGGKSIRFASFTAGTKQVSSRIALDKKGRILTGGDFLSVIDRCLTLPISSLLMHKIITGALPAMVPYLPIHWPGNN